MTLRTARACGGIGLASLVAMAVGAATAAAQDASRPARPAYDNLRFREDWSAPSEGDPFDRLKHLTVARRPDVWLSLGGHLRLRSESVDHFLVGGPGTRTDAFAMVRAHLHADLHVGPWMRGFVEGRVADVRGRSLPGGARLSDRNRGDLGNAFLEGRATIHGVRSVVRAGRQELSVGRERLMSPLDWANVRRVFEGVSAEARRGSVGFGVFAVHPMTTRPLRPDVADRHTSVWGSTVGWQPSARSSQLESALLVKSVRTPGLGRVARRVTLSSRVTTALVHPNVVLELEGGAQRVEGTGTPRLATMIASDVTWSPKTRWSPGLTIGLDRASGTHTGAPAQSGTWDQLYPLGHAFAGFADVLGRRNLVEERLVAQLSPRSAVRVRGAVHAFQRASIADATYDVAGAVFRPAGTSVAREVGREVDVTVLWRMGTHLRLDSGIARFTPGTFLHATGSAQRYTWGFSSLTAIF